MSSNPTSGSQPSRMIGFLLFVAGLGGLLYGIDVGIIAGVLPYLRDTFPDLDPQKLSFIVAAVLLGGVISTLFAGLIADLIGRRPLMFISGLLFVVSIPMIALSRDFGMLIAGRLLQGISGGLIGVVVPLYLAECLSASTRGKGTGIFQWLLVFGFVVSAIISRQFSSWINGIHDPVAHKAAEEIAWRGTFWISMGPGILFILGCLWVPESARWLFRRGRRDAARTALERTLSPSEVELEMREMLETADAELARSSNGRKIHESIFHRKYVIPFVLACIILACNQGTGINSIIGYNTEIYIQAGLSDLAAHDANFAFTLINFAATVIGVVLVDRKGRKFLLSIGTAGIIASLLCTGFMFRQTENARVDCKEVLQTRVTQQDTLSFKFDNDSASKLAAGKGVVVDDAHPATLVVIYSYGDYVFGSNTIRSDDKLAEPIKIDRAGSLPTSSVDSFFKDPFASLKNAQTAPLVIRNALITPVPSKTSGWITAFFTYCFMAAFAMGPGVCVWLALSELMPTRIRSNGMSVALLLNQVVSTTIAAIFLPTVGRYGYSTMFFAFAAFTVVYFITAAFFLPETKGKTLEEIEEHFSGKTKA
jgi:sugar porter (SP) family MFS transporter